MYTMLLVVLQLKTLLLHLENYRGPSYLYCSEIFLKSTVKRAKKKATCFVKLVLNELKSNVTRFTTYEKNLVTLFVTRQVRTSVVKRETSLSNSFCSNVSKQVARFFCCPFYCSLNSVLINSQHCSIYTLL